MTLTLDLAPEVEERLRREARRRGIEPARLALEAVEAMLPNPSAEKDEERDETPSVNGESRPRPEPINAFLMKRRAEEQAALYPDGEGPELTTGLKTIDAHLRRRREAGLEERPFYETATPEELIQAGREWAEGHPPLPDLAPGWDSRETMYEELTLKNLGPGDPRE